MSVNILDLARPEPSEHDYEHIHPVERMTGFDHAILAVLIAFCIFCWAAIGSVIATLCQLSPWGSIVTMILWPFPLAFATFIATVIIAPIWRLMRRNAERIEGYYD